jgi:hypothetical protein
VSWDSTEPLLWSSCCASRTPFLLSAVAPRQVTVRPCALSSLFARQLRFPVRQRPAWPEFFLGFLAVREFSSRVQPARSLFVFAPVQRRANIFRAAFFSQVQARCCLPLLALGLDLVAKLSFWFSSVIGSKGVCCSCFFVQQSSVLLQ